MNADNAKDLKTDGLHHDNWFNRRSIYHSITFSSDTEGLANKIHKGYFDVDVFAVLWRSFFMVYLRDFSQGYSYYYC